MAIIPIDRYSGAINPTTTDYPYGSAKNVTLPDAEDGTPFENAMVNDTWGLYQSLLKNTAIAPTGNPDTALESQYFDAINRLMIAHNGILQTQNNATNPNTHLDFLPGIVIDSTKSRVINLTSSLTKNLATSWAVGSGNGGRFDSVSYTINTWYYAFLIVKDSDGTIDAGFDTSPIAAHRPSGYTKYYHADDIYNKVGNTIVGFVRNGKLRVFKNAILDVNGQVNVLTSVRLTVPARDVNVRFIARCDAEHYAGMVVKDVKGSEFEVAGSLGDVAVNDPGVGNTFCEMIARDGVIQHRIGTSGQSANPYQIILLGWEDL